MSTTPGPVQDRATPILSADPSLSDQQRSDLWDAFHSKDPYELVQHLTPLAIPDDTKKKLFQAKQAAIAPPPPAPPAPAPVDKVTAAIGKMVTLPPDVLDKAEQHPQVLKAFTTAATAPEPEAPGAASATSADGKGKKASESAKTPLAPRADGQPHFPAIPDQHHRVLSGNGGVYDVPMDRIEDARKIDPSLHILNP